MNYFKVISRLKASTGCNYIVKHNDINQSVRVVIPGQYKPTDFTKEDEPLPFICINEDEYRGLLKPGHKGATSPFKILKETQKIFVEEIKFAKMPAEFQKKYNPAYFAKMQADKTKEIAQTKADKKKADAEGQE